MSIVWNNAPFKLKTQMFDLFSGDTIPEASAKGEPIDINNEIDNIQGLLSIENGRPVSMDETITFLLHNKDKFVKDDSNERAFGFTAPNRSIVGERPQVTAPKQNDGEMVAQILTEIFGEMFTLQREEPEQELFILHKHLNGTKVYENDGELTVNRDDAERFTEDELEDFKSEGWHVEIA